MAIDLGIDLGTASVKIFTRKQGIVLNEPSMVIASQADGRVTAIGDEANDMIGRTPDGVQAVRPIRNGVITNFNFTVRYAEALYQKSGKEPLCPRSGPWFASRPA